MVADYTASIAGGDIGSDACCARGRDCWSGYGEVVVDLVS